MMETALFANVKKLYDHKLYECVIPVASLLHTLLQNDVDVGTIEVKYQVLLYMGSANFKQQNYGLACKQLDSAVHMHKTMHRFKANVLTAIESSYEQFTIVELLHRLAMCHRELGAHSLAITTLQSIPISSRTPQINFLLARLLHHGQVIKKQEAILAYKDVLRDCPMSMRAIEALLELGVSGSEVNSLVVNAATVPSNIEWLSTWIKAQAQMYDRKHLEAAKSFQQLNDTTQLHQNELLLTHIGKCFYYHGNFKQAEQYLCNAAMINPHNTSAIASLAVVSGHSKENKPEHEKLFTQMLQGPEITSDHWFLFAQKIYFNGKHERALSFTQRALQLDPRNVEALLLRGKLFLTLAHYKEAISCYRNAQCIAAYRFEIYKGLFHCYLGLKRFKEAQAMCAMAVRNFRTSPRGYTMFGRTLFRSAYPAAKKSARKFVLKSLQLDASYIPGIVLLVEICTHEGSLTEAIDLLKKQLAIHPNPKLFTMMGDLLRKNRQLSKALHYYTLALSMETGYRRAQEGVNALTQALGLNTEWETQQNPGDEDEDVNLEDLNTVEPAMVTPCGTPVSEWECEEETASEFSPNMELLAGAEKVETDTNATETGETDSYEPTWQLVEDETHN